MNNNYVFCILYIPPKLKKKIFFWDFVVLFLFLRDNKMLIFYYQVALYHSNFTMVSLNFIIYLQSARLGISIVSTEVERRKVKGSLLMMGRCTNINIFYILIIVTKIENAIRWQIDYRNDVFLFSFLFDRSRVYSSFDAVVYDSCQHETQNKDFRLINFCNTYGAE